MLLYVSIKSTLGMVGGDVSVSEASEPCKLLSDTLKCSFGP